MGYPPASCFWRAPSFLHEVRNRNAETGSRWLARNQTRSQRVMKHSGPGFLNVMQTRFYPSVVSARQFPNFVNDERKISVGAFAFLLLNTTPRSRGGVPSWDGGNSRQNGINMYAKPNRRVSTAVVSRIHIRSSRWFYRLEWSSIDDFAWILRPFG